MFFWAGRILSRSCLSFVSYSRQIWETAILKWCSHFISDLLCQRSHCQWKYTQLLNKSELPTPNFCSSSSSLCNAQRCQTYERLGWTCLPGSWCRSSFWRFSVPQGFFKGRVLHILLPLRDFATADVLPYQRPHEATHGAALFSVRFLWHCCLAVRPVFQSSKPSLVASSSHDALGRWVISANCSYRELETYGHLTVSAYWPGVAAHGTHTWWKWGRPLPQLPCSPQEISLYKLVHG